MCGDVVGTSVHGQEELAYFEELALGSPHAGVPEDQMPAARG